MNPDKQVTKKGSVKKPFIPAVISIDASTLLLICAAALLVPLLLVGFFSL